MCKVSFSLNGPHVKFSSNLAEGPHVLTGFNAFKMLVQDPLKVKTYMIFLAGENKLDMFHGVSSLTDKTNEHSADSAIFTAGMSNEAEKKD